VRSSAKDTWRRNDSLAVEELAAYSQGGVTRVQIDGPSVLLEPSAAQAIAVTLQELATNAAKYGALSVPDGHVRVEWSHEQNGRLALRWTEKGGPPVELPTRLASARASWRRWYEAN
jgi:two-component sensor histidine kinase